MEQHPIPQNISSYQFRLVGDMTLKQFFQLAGGILIGFIIYSSPLLSIIKWPFVILSVVLGVGMAFFPLEERPLERWIIAFFRVIYSPTLFSWKKTDVSPKIFQDEPAPVAGVQAVVNDYVGIMTKTAGPTGKLESEEKGFLAKLSGLFSTAGSLIPLPKTQVKEEQPQSQSQTEPQGQVLSVIPQTSVTATPEPPPVPEKKEVMIPYESPIKVEHSPNVRFVVEESKSAPAVPQSVSPIVAGSEVVSTKQAIFSLDAAPPSPPSYPNLIVGQIVDQDRKIVEGAIMEIRDSHGRPIRALRSNKLGHFIIVTPLENGTYQIMTEKEGYEFSPLSFEATGALIPPILVEGHRNIPMEDIPMPVNKNVYSIN